MEGYQLRPIGCNGIDITDTASIHHNKPISSRTMGIMHKRLREVSEMTTNLVSSLVPFLDGSRKGSGIPSVLLFFLFSASV
jgi:hypothetical protein